MSLEFSLNIKLAHLLFQHAGFLPLGFPLASRLRCWQHLLGPCSPVLPQGSPRAGHPGTGPAPGAAVRLSLAKGCEMNCVGKRPWEVGLPPQSASGLQSDMPVPSHRLPEHQPVDQWFISTVALCSHPRMFLTLWPFTELLSAVGKCQEGEKGSEHLPTPVSSFPGATSALRLRKPCLHQSLFPGCTKWNMCVQKMQESCKTLFTVEEGKQCCKNMIQLKYVQLLIQVQVFSVTSLEGLFPYYLSFPGSENKELPSHFRDS